jgi:2,3-bisphosphoglycerate-dependent phosphoglycerate mutase
MENKKEFIVFRHGETDWNRNFRMQGTTDVPLNELGRSQALKLRDYFTSHPVDIFLSSDLGRALDTAKTAAGQSGAPIVTDVRLRETNLGAAEGLTDDEIHRQLGLFALESWRKFPDDLTFRFPGGESKAEQIARIKGVLEEFARNSPQSKFGVSTHGGSMRRFIHHLRPDLTSPIHVGNCYAFRLTYDLRSTIWEFEKEPVCSDVSI